MSWAALQALGRKLHLTRGGCHWVTFESIRACLCTENLEDAHLPYVKGVSRDDARIAYLVRRIEAGEELDPMNLRADVHPLNPQRIKVWFFDGSHRFRAYQFTRRMHRLPIRLSGSAAFELLALVPFLFRQSSPMAIAQ